MFVPEQQKPSLLAYIPQAFLRFAIQPPNLVSSQCKLLFGSIFPVDYAVDAVILKLFHARHYHVLSSSLLNREHENGV
jgi:hypothetical protein